MEEFVNDPLGDKLRIANIKSLNDAVKNESYQ